MEKAWKFCPQCGSRIQDGWKFCAECGEAVTNLAAIAATAPAIHHHHYHWEWRPGLAPVYLQPPVAWPVYPTYPTITCAGVVANGQIGGISSSSYSPTPEQLANATFTVEHSN